MDSGGGFASNFDITLVVEQALESHPKDEMIIGNQHAYGSTHCLISWRSDPEIHDLTCPSSRCAQGGTNFQRGMRRGGIGTDNKTLVPRLLERMARSAFMLAARSRIPVIPKWPWSDAGAVDRSNPRPSSSISISNSRSLNVRRTLIWVAMAYCMAFATASWAMRRT